MLTATAISLLLAAPPITTAFVVTSTDNELADAVARVVCAELPRGECFDHSDAYRLLFLNPVPGAALAEPTAPPKAWPREAVDDLATVQKACEGLKRPENVRCYERGGFFLWYRLLSLRHVKRLVEVTWYRLNDQFDVTVTAGTVGEATAVRVTSHVPASRFAEKLEPLIRDALAAKGSTTPTLWLTSMAQVAPSEAGRAPTPAADAPGPVTTPIANLPVCPAAPASLEIADPGTLGGSVMARWQASHIGTGPRAQCTLAESTHIENGGLFPIKVLRAVLTCAKNVVTSEAMVGASGMVTANGVEVGSKKLVTALAKLYCP